MRKRLLHCACISVTQPKLFQVAPSCITKWGDFEQREILWLEKVIQISPARTVTICDMMHKVISAHPRTHWEKLTFDQSFVSKHHFFSFENCRLDNKKEGQRGRGDI